MPLNQNFGRVITWEKMYLLSFRVAIVINSPGAAAVAPFGLGARDGDPKGEKSTTE